MSVPKGWTPRGIDYRFSGTFIGARRDGRLVPFKVSGAGDNYITGTELGADRATQVLYRNVDLSFPKLGVVQVGDEAFWVTRSASGYKRGVDLNRLAYNAIGTYPTNTLPRRSSASLHVHYVLTGIFNPVTSTVSAAAEAILSGEKAGVRISASIAVAAMRGYIDPGIYYNNQLVGYVGDGVARIATVYDYVAEELIMLGAEVSYA